MDPVKRSDHNFVYTGPTPDIGDLSVQREPGVAYSHWKPTPEELATLNAGGEVRLGVFQEPMPPVSLGVAEAEEPKAEDPNERERNEERRAPRREETKARLADEAREESR